MFQKIINFFRKPSLMLNPKIFGVDISDYSIEIIALTGSSQNPQLLAMGSEILKTGIIEDNIILNKEKLKDTLKNLIKNPQFGEIKSNKFIFSLPESRCFVHVFELPQDFKKEEELEFVESEASRTFPFLLSELYFDFIVRTKSNSREVLLVASPKNIINEYLEVFKSLKLQPIAVDIESESLARVLIEKIEKNQAVLIVDIGAKVTNFGIFEENGLSESFSNKIGGNKFTQVLSEKLKISLEEAENLKKEIGLNPGRKGGKVFLILQKEIQEIILEIRKIEDYFQKKEGKKITKIILAGGSSQMPRLQKYLTENLEKEVLIGDPWVKINVDILREKEHFKKGLKPDPVLYSTAIGSALRGLAKNPEKIGINLIKNIKTSRRFLELFKMGSKNKF